MNAATINGGDVYRNAIQLLQQRGVQLEDIAELVMFLQKDYIPDLERQTCLDSVQAVLQKREVQNALLTGIQLDMLAEQNRLISPLQEMMMRDEPLYGVDEVMSLAILNIYGSIGLTNYGYIDKLKYGILERLNDKQYGVHTFLDDLVGAIAAAASSRIAHNYYEREEERQHMKERFNQTVK
ncbi:phosphatidylglycerophosphatase A [Brevibacillus humidisoli]|uniref:phosphatidylglycerophosphatase A family protein n=1 Tax=Brevibacillus humidisoli TaxID=2895522 RepID=UPI001E4843DD|nr:phosphatidylglycerophosphatase A [Brevibacillus humidisoli]UFJ39675.1 phosphatidylglycerophosphatase A [Brevibacillus humidisoli]